jgi:hypothetical protein
VGSKVSYYRFRVNEGFIKYGSGFSVQGNRKLGIAFRV